MRRSIALLAIALIAPASALGAPRWTFCVASSRGGDDVWITDVFAAKRDRERLEGAFRSMVERLGRASANAQCPRPRDDKTEAMNARFDAVEFNRKLGAKLHPVLASGFPAGRPQASREPPSPGKRSNPKLQDELPVGSNAKPRQDEQ
jgi:hypothetical protein